MNNQKIKGKVRNRFFFIICFVSVGLVMSTLSCTTLVKAIYNIHNPRYESDENIIAYCDKIGLPSNFIRVKHLSSKNKSVYHIIGKSVPDVFVFNTNGHMVDYQVDCSSSIAKLSTLGYEELELLPVTSNSLSDLLEHTYTINACSIDSIKNHEHPIVMLKFAKYAGKLNKDIVEYYRELKSSSIIKYELILLNVDYSEKTTDVK